MGISSAVTTGSAATKKGGNKVTVNLTQQGKVQLIVRAEGAELSKSKNGGYIYELTYKETTLGEFDEGPNSGWLYKVNDVLPSASTKEYDVADKDVILFYYTEDWTKDPDAASNAGIKPAQTTEETKIKQTFIDVKDTDWYDEYAEKAAELGLTPVK